MNLAVTQPLRAGRIYSDMGDGQVSVVIAAPLGAKRDGGWRGDLDNDTYVPERARALTAHGSGGSGKFDEQDVNNLIAHSLRADGFDASEDGTGRGTPITLAIRGRGDSHDLECRQDGTANAVLTPNGGRGGIGVGAVAFANTAGDTALGMSRPGVPPLTGRHGDPGNVLQDMTVRRLTPRECERLQGFPDDYTAITYKGKAASDGPRYRALGNSMAVPVMAWIGRRIQMADETTA